MTNLICLADIEPVEVSWLWRPYLPLGKLVLLEGDPEIGKTFLALSLVAAVTKGEGLPGFEHQPPGTALYLSAEDGLADTLRPRLDAAGADTGKVFVPQGPVALTNPQALGRLLELVRPRLVVIDPLQAFLGARVDMHRANEVRPVLQGVAALAEAHACTVVAIRHLAKGSKTRTIYSGLGSIDFAAAARSMLLVGRAQGETVMAHAKSSLAPRGPSLRYEISASRLHWLGESPLTPADLLAPKANTRTPRQDAATFLRSLLAHGPVPATRVLTAATAAGIAHRTLERAKVALAIESRRVRDGSGGVTIWRWSLPSTAKPEPVDTSLGDDGIEA